MQTRFGLTTLAIVLVIAWTSTLTFAGAEVKPEGKVYAHYYYNVSGYPDWYAKYPENDYNGFELSRVYFGAKVKLSDHWDMRATADVAREDSYELEAIDEDEDGVIDSYELVHEKKTGKYGMYIKYAYLNYAPFDFFGIRFGQHQTPWIDKASKAWNYRFVAKTLTDKYKFESSSDLGLSFLGEIPEGFGSYQIGVFNGEGYKKPEANEGKAFHGRVLLTPLAMLDIDALKGLTIGGSYKWDNKDPDAGHEYSMYTALLHYFYKITDDMSVNVGFEFAAGHEIPSDDADADEEVDSMGYAGFLEFAFFKGLAVFGRYDFYDPNTKNDKDKGIGYQDELNYIVAGISYKPIKYVKLALDYQTTTYTAEVVDDEGDEQTKPADSHVFLNAEFKF